MGLRVATRYRCVRKLDRPVEKPYLRGMAESREVRVFYERLEHHLAANGYKGIDAQALVPDANSDDTDHLDEALFAVGALHMWLADREMIGVFRARAAGHPWTWIAERLGRSRQAVWERYRDRTDDSLEA